MPPRKVTTPSIHQGTWCKMQRSLTGDDHLTLCGSEFECEVDGLLLTQARGDDGSSLRLEPFYLDLKRRAWELVKHHRLLELFLHDVLKYSWDEVHEKAERLEHFITERFEDRVAEIPQKHEHGVFRDEVLLIRWPVRTPAVISSVSDRSASALRELERLGLRQGTAVNIEQRNSAGALAVNVGSVPEPVRVSNDLAHCLLVVAVESQPKA